MVSDLLPTLLLLVQATAPATVAPESVEVEVQVTGSVDVPAQGYRVSVYSAPQPQQELPSPPLADARRKALISVDALGPVGRPACSSDVTKIGFIGNEATGGPAPEEAEPGDIGAFEQVQKTFISLADAQKAEELLIAAGFKTFGKPNAILFECDAATRDAKAEALKTSSSKAQEYAGLLGLRVRGLKRLSDRVSDPWSAALAGAATGQRLSVPEGKVRVTATVTVTYALER